MWDNKLFFDGKQLKYENGTWPEVARCIKLNSRSAFGIGRKGETLFEPNTCQDSRKKNLDGGNGGFCLG